ncbi:uncharacterized protein EI90DRAFT_3124716 [Cantharellus anzutake]|uniref:uncharacterized protein n=1 Tax=Cantharellus anzutake TaxID=1750568 RepID=UPI001908BA4D|nr:uncharacterized protein EI90DRAFT_3124716 [Cantharellus anzutake]KAF8329971.1 hypothetical protein EI90DRAFT_3124716 [Cantharellus anzutake]
MPAKTACQHQAQEQLWEACGHFQSRIHQASTPANSDSEYQYESDSTADANNGVDDSPEEDDALCRLQKRSWQKTRELAEVATKCDNCVLKAFTLKPGIKRMHSEISQVPDMSVGCGESSDALACDFENRLERLISRFESLAIETFNSEGTINMNDKDTNEDAPDNEDPLQHTSTATDVITSIESIISEEEPDEDILVIANNLLKQATGIKTRVTLKTIMILTAVVSYEKLHCAWSEPGPHQHKQPRKGASLAISAQMGKGPAFACKIHEMVPYIPKYHKLPECAQLEKLGAGSLLDNEAIVAGIHHYLATVNLGQITPHLLAKHVNEDLLPKL